jgi:hypothetical protein
MQGWLRRLSAQLPGWHVWYSGAGGLPGTSGWCAVPAPPETQHTQALSLPNKAGPFPTPQLLRAACKERYGWDDHCESCGRPARECGHRQPEREHGYC